MRGFWSWSFVLHMGSDDFITVHNFNTEGRLVKTKEFEIPFRPRGVANNMEPQRSLLVERPLGKRQAEKRARGQLASGVTTYCILSRGQSNKAPLCKSLLGESSKFLLYFEAVI